MPDSRDQSSDGGDRIEGKGPGAVADDFQSRREASPLLYKCDDGWEGPTCAMPTKESSCGVNGGQLTSIGRKSPHHQTAGTYNYCKCTTPEDGSLARTGHYCDGNAVSNRYAFATSELKPCQSIQLILSGSSTVPTLVECNDPDGNNPCDVAGLCQTCADENLDPDALCIEYKAVGVGGIVDAHQNKVKINAGC